MKILKKEPRGNFEEKDIPNTLEALQGEVGGYIEALTFAPDACFIVNEEGLIKALPFNFSALGHFLFGNVLLVGVSGDEFCDVPESAVKLVTKMLGGDGDDGE